MICDEDRGQEVRSTIYRRSAPEQLCSQPAADDSSLADDAWQGPVRGQWDRMLVSIHRYSASYVLVVGGGCSEFQSESSCELPASARRATDEVTSGL
jgi:hypothetical protein